VFIDWDLSVLYFWYEKVNRMLVYVKKEDFKGSCAKYKSWFDNLKVVDTEKSNLCIL